MKTALKEVSQGQEFTLAGIKWVVLDHFTEATFILAADVLEEMAFNDDEHEVDGHANDWRKASLREYLNTDFYSHLIGQGVPKDAIKEVPVDLTSDDGMTDYGTTNDNITLLTADQYRQYRRFIPNASDWWWLVTPYSCLASYSDGARIVNSDGSLDASGAYAGSLGVRPACLLSSDITVEIEGEDPAAGDDDQEEKKFDFLSRDIYDAAITEWGSEAQIDMAIEEMSELTTALLHARRNREANIAEEIADVRIMIAQLELIFKNSDEVEKIKAEKIDRLARRLFGE